MRATGSTKRTTRGLQLGLSICLLFGGCQGISESVPQPTNPLRMLPARLRLNGDKDELRDAVGRDPFPKAAEVGLQI